MGGPSAPVDYTTHDQNRPRGVGNVGTPSAPVEYEPYDRNERRGFVNVGPPIAPSEYTPFDWNEQEESDLESRVGYGGNYSVYRGNYCYN